MTTLHDPLPAPEAPRPGPGSARPGAGTGSNHTHTGKRPAPSGYLTTSQVAEVFHVSPKTVSRWAKLGKLPCARTIGGHRRYPEDDIRWLAAGLEHPLGTLPPSP
jgi:excisionase family DNA binding protein